MKVIVATKNVGKVEGVNRAFSNYSENFRSNHDGISLLINDVISRIDLTESAFLMPLTKYINDNIWNNIENNKKFNLIK